MGRVTASRKPIVSIVVPNWEGEEWLGRCLSSLQLSAQQAKVPFEIIVVDDSSSDNSVGLIQKSFPHVTLLKSARNRGFGSSTTRGVWHSQGKLVLLCNNDLVATDDFVGNLYRWFREKQVKLQNGLTVPRSRLFAVSARTMSWWDGTPNHVCMNPTWRGGRITPEHKKPNVASRCVFVQAGAAMYRRDYFLKIGGLKRVYKPGYWEDYDLSYRAARAGFVPLYDPQAVALHHGGGSMTKRYGTEGVRRYRARNHLIFEWSNLSDAARVAEYATRLGFSVGKEFLRGDTPHLAQALRDASPKIASALQNRVDNRRALPDRDLLKWHYD